MDWRTPRSLPTPDTTRTSATTTRAASAMSLAVISPIVHLLVPTLVEEEGTRVFAHVEVEHAADDDLVVAPGILRLEPAVEVRDRLLEHRRSRHADAPRRLPEAVGTLLGEQLRERFVVLTEDVHRERARALDARPGRRRMRDAEQD